MCCFSRPVPFVGSTRIFARTAPGDCQALAYAMDVALREPLAMVLPIPVPPRPREDAVAFVSLEGYGEFFDDLGRAFPPLVRPLSRGPATRADRAATLAVHEVGMYVASFVPTRADFARLDARFRLPESLWDERPDYADWGFAVVQLKPTRFRLFAERQRVHPIALTFPSREAGALYFPLLHVHDGGHAASHADFDHVLYAQAEGVLDATLAWTRSSSLIGETVDSERARGLVDAGRGACRSSLVGRHRNADLWLRPPPTIVPADLGGRGECHEYAVSLAHAHALDADEARARAWQRTARHRGAALCRGLRDGLANLERSRREAWKLTALTDDLRPHFVNGGQLWEGIDPFHGKPAPSGGPGRVRFAPFSDRVAPQSVTLAFSELPDQARTREIEGALARLLDRAVA